MQEERETSCDFTGIKAENGIFIPRVLPNWFSPPVKQEFWEWGFEIAKNKKLVSFLENKLALKTLFNVRCENFYQAKYHRMKIKSYERISFSNDSWRGNLRNASLHSKIKLINSRPQTAWIYFSLERNSLQYLNRSTCVWSRYEFLQHHLITSNNRSTANWLQ